MSVNLRAFQLGGGLIKLRIARLGSGKSGGYRTIIAYSAGRRAVFLFGFAKNQRDNLTPVQLADLKMVGDDLLALTEHQLTRPLPRAGYRRFVMTKRTKASARERLDAELLEMAQAYRAHFFAQKQPTKSRCAFWVIKSLPNLRRFRRMKSVRFAKKPT
jgi:hypothetical protein